jgi:hypothetical protein
MVLVFAESQAVGAPFRGDIDRLSALHDGSTLVAGEGALTFSVKDIEAEPGTSAPVSIRLPSSSELRAAGAEDGAFLLIRHIPKGVSFSAGMATGRVWVVPLREASTLRLFCTPEANARFHLGFHLIGPDKRALAQTIVAVNLRPSQTVATLTPPSPKLEGPPKPPVQPLLRAEPPAPRAEPAKPAPRAEPAPPEPAELEPLTPQEETILMERGREVLKQGSVVAARLIFEELASHGSAAGALALARSYDPAYAAPSATPAPASDLAEARKWYERAAALGNSDAKRRLADIASGR